jgi:hypothetical protein
MAMDIRSSVLWDILSVMMLAAAVVVLVIYGIIFINPDVPFNAFSPGGLPGVVILPSPTATLFQFPATNTPTVFNTPTGRPTITFTPTITYTPTFVTPTVPTATITRTPTITPTITRTPTRTTNPIIFTRIALTSIAGTRTAQAQETRQAQTRIAQEQTQNAQRTLQAQQTLNAGGTQTAIVQTSTAQVLTQTQGAFLTQTSEVITATAVAEVTVAAEVTRTEQAVIILENPIAYSVDTDSDLDTAERFHTQKLINGPDGATEYELNIGSLYTGARPASAWWMGDTDNHFLLFADPTNATSNIYRVLYSTIATIQSIATDIRPWVGDVSVDRYSGLASDRRLVFTFAAGGAGTDRNLYTSRGDGTNTVQISDDASWDDHSPSWVISPTSSYHNRILYVTRSGTGAQNIYLMLPETGSYPGTRLTFYDVNTTQISSPKWCTGYDWENEEWYERIVFGMRTSAGDDWNIYSADPVELIANQNNESILQLTSSSANEYQPDWSPFCEKIVFISDQGGNTNVWTMDRDGSNQVRLTNNTLVQMSPLWMPYID